MRICLYISLMVLLQFPVFSQWGPQQRRFTPAQHDTAKQFPRFVDRLYYGGNLGFWIGNPIYVNVSPAIGVKIDQKLSVGASFTYNYYQQTYQGSRYVNYIYGGGPFVRYKITDNIFAQAEWDHLSILDPNSIIENDRIWVDNLLIGGGFRQPFSNHASFMIMAFWNLNQTPLSPYPNPIIQMGFNVRF